MKGRNVILLIVLAAALIGAAVWSSKKQQIVIPENIGKNILPDLQINSICRITITSPGSTATVAKTDSGWVVPSRFDYPANYGKIRDNILKMSEMKIGQVVAADDAARAALKMLPPSAASGGGILVELAGEKNNTIASLLIGETRNRKAGAEMQFFGGYPDGQYVSPDSGKTVCISSEMLNDLSPNVKDWLDSDLINLTPSDVMEVTVTPATGTAYRVSRNREKNALEIEGLKEDQEGDPGKVYALESCLSYLKMSDVADPKADNTALGFDKQSTCEVVTRQGERYLVSVGRTLEGTTDRPLRIRASVDPLPPPPPKPAEAAPTNTPATNAPSADASAQAARAALEKQHAESSEKVKRLNEKFSKWTFLLPAHKTDLFITGKESIVKAKKKEEDATKQTENTKTPDKPAEKKAEEKKHWWNIF